jgi:hypothetical protein
MDPDTAIVIDETEFAKAIHEEAAILSGRRIAGDECIHEAAP